MRTYLVNTWQAFIFSISVMIISFQSFAQVDIQGHRGARGLMPENTIPAFKRAIDEGVNTLELDVVITKDHKVLVSHEPFMSASICTKPNGEPVEKGEMEALNIYQMTYAEVAEYDCGSRGNSRFPQQEKLSVQKPLLSDMITAAEAYTKEQGVTPLNYNIEIKSSAKGDGVNHPDVAEFSRLVNDVIEQYLPRSRYTLQSFDFRVLQYWHKNYPEVTLVALIENTKSVKRNISDLGFIPDVYSPYYKLLTKSQVEEIHEKGMKVIPWTVNSEREMRELIEMGVDGLITDYPNLAKRL